MVMSYITGAFIISVLITSFNYVISNWYGILPPVNKYLTYSVFLKNDNRHAICASTAVLVSLQLTGTFTLRYRHITKCVRSVGGLSLCRKASGRK